MSAVALAGLRVVDLSCGVAGPLCGKLLADAGAIVTKVEPRAAGPARAPESASHWPEFLNRGKHVAGAVSAAELDALLDEADVVLGSATHRASAAAGLDCPSLLERHPGLVAACVTPFGQSGPYADFAADDLVLCALSGLADATPGFPDHCERPDDPPVQSLAPLAEAAGGIVAANAVVGAVLGAARGASRVRHVEVSVHEAAAAFMAWEWGMATYGGGIRGRRPIPADLAPNCLLRCRDGLVVLVAFTEPHWRGLVEVLGSPDWAADERYADAASRARNWDSLRPRLAAWAREQRGVDVLEAAQARGLPCCCSFQLRDVLESRHVREVGSLDRSGDAVFPADPIVVDGRRRSAKQAAGDGLRAKPGASGDRPLAGIRVLDLGQVVAGPFAGQLLAALGAEVILIESRTRPLSRLFGPFVGEPAHEASMMFAQVNRGKSSVDLDLTSEDGRRLLDGLVASADVVLENFSRRAAERLRITHDALSEVNPRIVLASISGFGRTGPWGDYVALHSGVILLSGLASVTLDADAQSRLVGAIYPDLLAGAYAALAIQQALALREQTGRGCHVEVAMLDVLLTCMGGLVPAAAAGETFAPHPGRFVSSGEGPGTYVAVGDPGADVGEIASLPRREAMERLQARGVRAGAVLDIGEVIADPHLAARGFVERGDHPIAGDRPLPAVPWLYDGRRARLRHAPLLGERTEEALVGLAGVTREEVEALRRSGVLA